MESILTSIKKLLGISEEYEHFDADIIMHINSVFMTLTQLGVGPSNGFYIEDDETIWSDFISDSSKLQAVKSYMFMKVKLLFDPGSLGSSTLAMYERLVDQFEWRLNVAAEENVEVNDDTPSTVPSVVTGVVVDCIKLNVRSQPTSSAEVVCVILTNSKVTVDTTRVTEDWYYVITSDGFRGYCLKSNIRVYL